MFTGTCRHSRRHGRHWHGHGYDMPSSGNSAFDAYKADTLKRLEEEQEAFSAFLQRLRDAKDKQEFDAFMDDRARAARDGAGRGDTGAPDTGAPDTGAPDRGAPDAPPANPAA